jgi:hypothetical protein
MVRPKIDASQRERHPMKLGTILVHLDPSQRCAVRVELAAALAKKHGSHLIGLIPTGLYDSSIPADALAPGRMRPPSMPSCATGARATSSCSDSRAATTPRG